MRGKKEEKNYSREEIGDVLTALVYQLKHENSQIFTYAEKVFEKIPRKMGMSVPA